MYNRYSLQIDDDFSPVAAFDGPPERPGRPGPHPSRPHPFDPPPHHPHEPPPPHHPHEPQPPSHHPHEPPPPPHHHPHEPPPPPPPIHIPGNPGGGESSLLGSIKSLLGNFHMPKFELDDLLLIAIAYLLLRESGDDDLILIIVALFVFGVID